MQAAPDRERQTGGGEGGERPVDSIKDDTQALPCREVGDEEQPDKRAPIGQSCDKGACGCEKLLTGTCVRAVLFVGSLTRLACVACAQQIRTALASSHHPHGASGALRGAWGAM